MSKTPKHKSILLTIISFLWSALGIVCLGLAVFFIAFYDSPINPETGMGIQDTILIGSVFAFPIVCLISSIGIWILRNRSNGAAYFIAFLPIIPLSIVATFFVSPDSSFLKESNDVQLVSECAPAVPNVNDGLTTAGSGFLESGGTVSGTFNSISEAHNWQIDVETGQVSISVENDSHSCPHLIIFDTTGKVTETFEERNNLQLCPSGLTTTSFFQFSPPSSGIYFIRVFSPESPGSYWIKIE